MSSNHARVVATVEDAPANLPAPAEGRVVQLAQPNTPQPFQDEKGLHIPTPTGLYITFTTQRTLTNQQLVLLSPLGIEADFDPSQVAAFLMTTQRRGLDPWQREAYLMRYKDRGNYRYVHHTGIDGLRGQAESTGQYRGQIGPQWCGTDGEWRDIWPHRDKAPFAARVGILRSDFDGPLWGVAHYDEYAPLKEIWEWSEARQKKVGTGRFEPTKQWKPATQGGKAALMTAKVSEALALRKAFPRAFAGLHITEEFDQLRQESREAEADERADKRRAAYEAATSRPQPAAEPEPQPAEQSQPADDAPTDTAGTPDPQPRDGGEDWPATAQLGAGAPDEADDPGRRERLMAELDSICERLGTTRTQMANRWVMANRRSFEDITDDELSTLVEASGTL